jgi:CrcB protein
MARLLWICLFGAIGTGIRYGVGVWASRWPNFPYATLIVNVAGCFLIAAISQYAVATSSLSDTQKLTLTTGLMGGLTTYSSFNLDTTTLVRQNQYTTAMLNVGATLGICFLAGLAGMFLTKRLLET